MAGAGTVGTWMFTGGGRAARAAALVLGAAAMALGGCASYRTPGGPADLASLAGAPRSAEERAAMVARGMDPGVLDRLDRKPAARFPAVVAVARLQDRNYSSYTSRGYGAGRYTLVTTRDVERDVDFQRISTLPGLAGLAPLNRLVVPQNLDTDADLRRAAAEVQADILLVYTFDTSFATNRNLPVLSLFTLGVLPTNRARVESTASAAFIDTRTGFVYGLAESSARATRLANGWSTEAAVDASRRDAEREAFDLLLKELERTWSGIVVAHAPHLSLPGQIRTTSDQPGTTQP